MLSWREVSQLKILYGLSNMDGPTHVLCFCQSARLAQSVEHGTLTCMLTAWDIPGSWVRAPHRAQTIFWLPLTSQPCT